MLPFAPSRHVARPMAGRLVFAQASFDADLDGGGFADLDMRQHSITGS